MSPVVRLAARTMNEHASTWEWLERLNFRLSIHDRDFARRSKHELSGGRAVLHLHHSAQSVIGQSLAVDGGGITPARDLESPG